MSGRFLLDTNIISETMRDRPDARFLRWYKSQKMASLFLSSVTIAELWQGVALLDAAHGKIGFYRERIELIERAYNGRILSFDAETARLWGLARGQAKRKGRIIPELDMQIAAIALQHKLTLVTANMRHFTGLGISLLNLKEAE